MLRISIFVLALCPAFVHAQGTVFTAQNDTGRTAVNQNETILSPLNVKAGGFGKLFTRAVDGNIAGQPLYVPNVNISPNGMHNIVYTATTNNSVYAFDADDPGLSAPLWRTSLGPTAPATNGVTAGILGPPVIEAASGTLYAVALIQAESPIYQLHALDLLTGAEKPNSPVLIEGKAGPIAFDASRTLQSSGLLLAGGKVYVAFESGWIFGYDAATLQQTAAQNLAPGRAGLSADSAGFIYACTGNGIHDGILKFGGSCVKLDPSQGLAIVDTFSGDAARRFSGGLAYNQASGSLYVWSGDDRLKSYPFAGGVLAADPASMSTAVVPYGAALSVSANGNTAGSGIVWATTPGAPPGVAAVPGALRAFDASDVSIELWNSDWDSDRNGGRDALGNFAPSAAPTVANGKVYVPTSSSQLVVYGMLASAVADRLSLTSVKRGGAAVMDVASANAQGITLTGASGGRIYEGLGAVSAGASSRLLID